MHVLLGCGLRYRSAIAHRIFALAASAWWLVAGCGGRSSLGAGEGTVGRADPVTGAPDRDGPAAPRRLALELGAGWMDHRRMEMTPERWRYTSRYLVDVFGESDDHLSGLMHDAVAAGLPDIAVSPDVGRLLLLLTSMTRAELVIELGTLAGYSTIWLARGLKPSGRVITVEPEESHAAFAEAQLAKAGVADRVEVRRGYGIPVLEALRDELPPASVDVVFLDAVKREYPDYFHLARDLIRPGGLLLADNVIGSGAWWIDHEHDPERNGADELNRTLAADPDFEAVAVPIREGLLIARRR